MALNELKTADENGVLTHSNVLPASLCSMQAAADNNDFLEETTDRKFTTHVSIMILIQQQSTFQPGMMTDTAKNTTKAATTR